MANPGDFAYIVKQQADIVRIVGDYVKLKKAGAQNYSGLCPFHGEKTPSFSVHATRQFFHCFGCGLSGDVFTFVQKIENITFPESVRAVAQKLGIAIPKTSFNTPQEAEDAKLRTVLLEVHERATTFFQECLRRPEGAQAREHLATRGLNQDTIQQFRIGYAPDSGFLLRDRLKNEFPEEVLRESGLFSWKQTEETTRSLGSARDDSKGGVKPEVKSQKPETASIYSKFRNRIQFPITNETGRVIAFTGRTLAADEKAGPKYLNSPETAIYSKSRVLFNLDRAKEAVKKLDYAILVEGQMDCISVYAAGFHNVVASSGTAFTGIQTKLLARYSKNVVVNFDPDTAGAKATERTLGLLIEEEFQIKVLSLEPGFDPDLFLRRKGKEAYEDVLRKSPNYFHFLIERARQQFPVRSGEGKAKAVNFLLPHIQRVPSRIVRDELAAEISQKLGIDSVVLRQELKHAATNRSSASVKAPVDSQITDAEKMIIRALCAASEIQLSEEHSSSRDGVDDEFDPARQARYVLTTERLHIGLATESLLEAILQASTEINAMDLPLPDSERSLLATILLKEDEELGAEKLEGAVKALRRIHLRRRLEQVQHELQSRQAQQAGRLQELMTEKIRLKRALMDPSIADNQAPPAA
ncbi:MAG TPA: DNA primase [Terriglobales bacterium]|nr:DNA primase [Terriglobales bacterium]